MGYSPTQYNLLGFSQDGGFGPKFVAENEEFDARQTGVVPISIRHL